MFFVIIVFCNFVEVGVAGEGNKTRWFRKNKPISDDSTIIMPASCFFTCWQVYLLKRLRPWRPVGCPPAAANVAFILGIAAFCESGLYYGLSWWSEENQCEAAAMSLSVEMKGQINDYNWMVLEFNEIKKAGFLNQIVAYFGWYSVEFEPLL